MERTLRSLIICFSVLALMAANAYAVSYQVTDIGTFGNAWVSGVNNHGVLAGTVGSPGGESSGFTWSSSVGLAYLSPLSGYGRSAAAGINDSGQVVGYSSLSLYPYTHRTSLWEEGEPVKDIGSFGAVGINNVGQVVGETDNLDVVLWDDVTGMQTIITDAYAYAINDNGTVVGQHNNYSFIWTASTGMHDIDAANLVDTTAIDINNSGQVICQQVYASVGGFAYLWQEGHETVSLGALSEDNPIYTYARDINNLGAIVGDSGYQPFVWGSLGGIQALPLDSGLSHGVASAINDSGVIAGYAYDDQGNTHLLLWTIPEPSSLLALLAGLVGFGVVLRRRGR